MAGRKGVLLLMIASVVISVVLVDLVLLAVLGPVRVVEEFYEPDPRCGYRMRPKLEFVFANPYHGYHATVRTNARGLRDDDFVVPKPVGTYRILLLGDSMTASLEVDKDDSFEALLEKRLSAHGPVDVINAGVRGYNLDNIIAFLEHEGLSYEPDLVVYLFVDNDLTDAPEAQPKQADASRGFSLQGAWGRLANYSHLTYRLAILRQTFLMRRQRDNTETPSDKVSVSSGIYAMFTHRSFEATAFHRTGERILRLADLTDDIGSDFLLVGAPHREEIDPESQAWWRRHLERPDRRLDFDGVRLYLEWVGGQYEVAYLDPVPAFRRELQGDKYYWFHKDNHLNATGHRLLADVLTTWVVATPGFAAWRAGVETAAP